MLHVFSMRCFFSCKKDGEAHYAGDKGDEGEKIERRVGTVEEIDQRQNAISAFKPQGAGKYADDADELIHANPPDHTEKCGNASTAPLCSGMLNQGLA